MAGTYDGKLVGIPYRLTAQILMYQKALLQQAGFAQAPRTYAEFEKAALAVNSPPTRYGFGLMGKQGAGHVHERRAVDVLRRRTVAGFQDG